MDVRTGVGLAEADGLWALEAQTQRGDVELLQLARRDYAGLVGEERQEGVLQGAGGERPTLAIQGATPKTLALNASRDELTLTDEDGHVASYRRSYRLYCVPADPSVEATMLIELGGTPRLKGVNGNGRTFPPVGTFDAAVTTDVLFRLGRYVVQAKAGATLITITLPWAEMTQRQFTGSIAIVGRADGAPETAITCEPIVQR